MAGKITVTLGGEHGAPVYDYSGESKFFSPDGQPLISGGMRWDMGGASQGHFQVIDDAGAIPRADDTHNLGARNVVLWTEDASGCEHWLSRGRISSGEADRGDHPWGTSKTLTTTWDDANSDLEGLALTENWVRGAETDYARLVALQAYSLAGTASTRPDFTYGGTAYHSWRETTDITVADSHLCKNANTVSMPAKTYAAGTEIRDIIADCATTAGKNYGVVIHSTLGSTPSIADSWVPTSQTQTDSMVVPGAQNSALVVVWLGANTAAAAPSWDPDSANATNPTYPFTSYGSVSNTNGTTTPHKIEVFYLLNPTADVGGRGRVNLNSSGDHYSWWTLLLSDVESGFIHANDSFIGTSNMSNPGTTTNTISANANDLILSAVAYTTQQSAAQEPVTTTSGQTKIFGADGSGVSPGQDEFVGGISQQNAGAGGTITDSWSVTGALGGAMTQWDLAIQGASGGTYNCDDHLCLQYIVPTDTTTNVSPASVSDVYAEQAVDDPAAPVFPPIWDQGPASIADGQDRPVSTIISTFTNGTATAAVISHNEAIVAGYDRWIVPISDATSVNSTQAALRADAERGIRSTSHVTIQASVKVRATQTHLLRAGQLLPVKSAAAYGGQYLGTSVNVRIAELKWEPIAPEVSGVPGWYYAHMQLDRPLRLLPGGSTPGGSTVNTPTGVVAASASGAITALQGAPTRTRALTNKSGGSVIAGDVVIVDTANDDSFTTTTTAGVTKVIGVAQETIAANAAGLVALEGYVALVNVTASVTRGDYGATGTTVKKATGAGARAIGSFCQFLKGGTTPDAILFGVPDLSAGGAVPVYARDLLTRYEPHVDYTGSVVLDGAENPVMVEVTN